MAKKNELEKQFFYKGKNYTRSGMDIEESIKASKVAFNKAVKMGASRERLEKHFRKGFKNNR